MDQPYTFDETELLKPNYASIEPAKVGKGFKGRGNQGEGKVGKGPFGKHHTIKSIWERGPSGGDNPGWDKNDIGIFGRAYNVSIEDVENYGRSQELPGLQKKYNDKLEALDIRNTDGTLRQVQWGDTDAGLQVVIAEGVKAKELRNTEPARVRRERKAEDERIFQQNQILQSQNNAGKLKAQQLNQQVSDNKEERAYRKSRDEENDRRYYAQESARLADRASDKELLMAQLQAQKYEIDERNNLRRDEFEYRKQLDQRQRAQSLVDSFVHLAAAFAL